MVLDTLMLLPAILLRNIGNAIQYKPTAENKYYKSQEKLTFRIWVDVGANIRPTLRFTVFPVHV